MMTITEAITAIEARRDKLGISRAEVARRAGKGQPYVQDVLTGKRSCKLDVAAQLAAAVGMKLNVRLVKQ